ncbi:hypothetical protein EPD83_015835, partial [Phycicoccus sp. CMS6Z-2]|nr:hypothetical protein [Phycicoccus flavus]
MRVTVDWKAACQAATSARTTTGVGATAPFSGAGGGVGHHGPVTDSEPARPTVPAPRPPDLTDAERVARATAFADLMATRRSVRDLAPDPVPLDAVRAAVRAAASAPSGANLQPWRFVLVTDPEVKRRIREGAEAEERDFYGRRAGAEWLSALAPLGTDADKPFLTTAPVLVVV